MPGRGWYVVAAAIAFAAIALATWLAFTRIGGMSAGLVQFVVPGSIELALNDPGSYTIFHERASVVDGRDMPPADISGLRVSVRALEGGADIAVTPPAGRTTYSFGGRSGVSILAFTVATPGRYRLTAGYDDGRQQPQAVLAVSGGFIGEMLIIIGISLAIAFSGLAAGLILFVVVLSRRRRAIRAAARAGGWP